MAAAGFQLGDRGERRVAVFGQFDVRTGRLQDGPERRPLRLVVVDDQQLQAG